MAFNFSILKNPLIQEWAAWKTNSNIGSGAGWQRLTDQKQKKLRP